MKIGVYEIIPLIVSLIVYGAVIASVIYLFSLVVRALRKYINAKSTHDEKEAVGSKTLGEALKAERTHCGMTQEFAANSLGVSRQAVSKWESGASAPSTSNLLALAKLYGVSAEDLLKQVE